jgi:hypothetical protein
MWQVRVCQLKSVQSVESPLEVARSSQEPAVKLVSPERIADVDPTDEVGMLTKVGAYAGMAAAGLGAATLMGGLAVDFTDVALVAGLYGVASAIGSSRSDAIRAKGAAGPVLSALVTASDIAKRIKGAEANGVGGSGARAPKRQPQLGMYTKSTTADVSKAGSVAIPSDAELATRKAEAALANKVQLRVLEMRSQLGDSGMAALEDGVNQVMSADVQRILKVRPRQPAHACRRRVALAPRPARAAHPAASCHPALWPLGRDNPALGSCLRSLKARLRPPRANCVCAAYCRKEHTACMRGVVRSMHARRAYAALYRT